MPAGFEIVSKKSIENRKVRAVFDPPFSDKIESRQWKRNPSWLQMPTMTSADDKFVGLFAVYPDSSFCAIHATTNTGTYTVDWGDGTQEEVTSNIVAYHEYDYTNSLLAGTEFPVTFNSSTNRVSLSTNNYVNGDIIKFDSIDSGVGVLPLVEYYVRNVSGSTFQLSDTIDGDIIDILVNGNGNILSYKQALVTVTPTTGTLTRIDLQRRHTNNNRIYNVPWLDISLSLPNATVLIIGGSFFVTLRFLEKASLYNISKVTSLSSIFSECNSLVSVPFFDVPSTCTTLASAFVNCRSLQTIPEINAINVTNMQQLFDGCYTLKEPISIINTSKVTNTSYMYRSCYQIKRVPWMDTSAVTNMRDMFNSCYSLEEVPNFDTSNVTLMISIFSACRRLEYVPFFNTSKVTSMNSMFANCSSLITVPLYDTSSVTDISSMFGGCYSLRNLPLFNTSAVTIASNVFQNCTSLEKLPKYNFSNVTGAINSMFNTCRRLKEIPDLNFGVGKITSMSDLFRECDALVEVPMMDTSNVTNMNNLFFGCSSIQKIPLYDTSKVTTMISTFQSCSSLREAPAWNTSAVTNVSSMFIACNTLEIVPEYDFTNVTTANALFGSCLQLVEIPWILNLPSATSVRQLFDNCVSLNYIPKVNIPVGADAYRMFYSTNLIEMPEIDFSSITSLSQTFDLTPALKIFNATGMKVSFNVSNHLFTAEMLNQIYTNLATVSGQTITVTGCIGTATDNPTIATSKGWTVVG